MSQREKDIMNTFDNKKLGLEDTFRFHCTMCGKCCINREDILMNPLDLYRTARALGVAPEEVFVQHCEAYLGKTSNMVIVRLVPVGSDKHCPLLKGNRCSVHMSKPTVCALFPLGRGLKMAADKKADVSMAEVQYFLQDVKCGSKSEKHTVREWLGEFDLSAEDSFFVRWTQVVFDYGSLVRQVQEKVSPETVQLLCSSILGGVYLNYDINEPFMPQFERNDAGFRKALSDVGFEPQAFTTGGKNEETA